jgi:hypothetical protein
MIAALSTTCLGLHTNADQFIQTECKTETLACRNAWQGIKHTAIILVKEKNSLTYNDIIR